MDFFIVIVFHANSIVLLLL